AAGSSEQPRNLSSRTASQAHGLCLSARPREERKIELGVRLWEERGNCWIVCWAQSAWTGRGSISPMSFLGGPPATEPQRLRKRRSVCLLLSDRSTSPLQNIWFALVDPRLARFWASREEFCAPGAHGSLIPVRAAAKSGRSRCSIRRSCCGNQGISDLRGQ